MSLGKDIIFKQNSGLVLEAYTNADYTGFVVDKRSTIGYCNFLGGNLWHGEVGNRDWWRSPV